MPKPHRPPIVLASVLVSSLAFVLGAATVHAGPTVGFQENFPGTSTSTWGGGSSLSNPGTGGVDGAGDGFLQVTTTFPTNLGAVSTGAEYVGDWTAAGVTQVRLWLQDVGGTGDLEIHFGIGTNGNFWQYNVGFVPPAGTWAEFTVDLSSASSFTQTHGSGTFAGALAGADRILLRHDLAPYEFFPDPIQASFGLDQLRLTEGSSGVEPGSAVARPVMLAPPYPNPARGRVTFPVQGSDGRLVTLRVFDASGRLVRHADLAAASGPRFWSWDGTDDQGRAAAPGVYRATATGAAGGSSRKFTLLR